MVSAHIPPGDPRSTVDWAELATSAATLVLMMGLEYLGQVAETLIRAGLDSRTPVSVIVDGTLPTQHIITTGLSAVAAAVSEAGLRPPAIVVIGEIVQVGAQIAELSRNALSKDRSVAVPTSPGGSAGARPTREGQ